MTDTMTDLWPVAAVEAPRVLRGPDLTGEAVLDAARSFMARFVAFPSDAALDVATAWAVHTHVTDTDGKLAFETTPRIAFLSKEPASGKTQALMRMGSLCRNGQILGDVLALGFASLISEYRADVLVDEIDGMIKGGGGAQQVRTLMLMGYQQEGAQWMRGSKPPISVFGALAFAGLDKKWRSAPSMEALRQRTIMIEMSAAAPGSVEEYRPREHRALAKAIRNDIAVWCQHNAGTILELYPEAPEGIHSRNRELCDPLLQVADAAGGHWPVTLRAALRELLLGESDAPPEIPLLTRLLEALEGIFAGTRQLSTVEIVTALFDLPDAPWRKLWPSDATAPRELAAMLAPLGVSPVKVRVGDRTMRGYRRIDLAEHWDC